MIHPLIKLCTKILSKDALFFLVNSYTTGLAPAVLTYMISTELKPWNGHVESQEIGLPVTDSGLVLPCGASGRWDLTDHTFIRLNISPIGAEIVSSDRIFFAVSDLLITARRLPLK
mgnify:FL=1